MEQRIDQIERYGVYWVDLNPTKGSEINKIRPCIIISPDELNKHLNTVIVVPLTTTKRNYPYRVPCTVSGKDGDAAIDQLKTIDKQRIGRYLGSLKQSEIQAIKDILQQMLIE